VKKAEAIAIAKRQQAVNAVNSYKRAHASILKPVVHTAPKNAREK